MNNWVYPKNENIGQQYLFKTSTDEVLAKLRVSHDDARRWLDKGWVSFDVGEVFELEPPLEGELKFIAAIARSGLNDALVNRLLSYLEKPYRYNPDSIAYSFEHGWVSPPAEQDPFEVIEENIEDWLTSLVEENETRRLRQLHERLTELLEEAESDDDEEAEV